MEIKIKSQGNLIEATLEVVDGVLVVSAKEDSVDVSRFKVGDVIVCGWEDESKKVEWCCILEDEIDNRTDKIGNYFIEDFCGMYIQGHDDEFWSEPSYSDSATYVRFATEEEKKALFDKIDQEGFIWDAEKKELVKKKWMPREGENFYYPFFSFGFDCFIVECKVFIGGSLSPFNKGWHFKTKEECQKFCDKLNKAISSIKP